MDAQTEKLSNLYYQGVVNLARLTLKQFERTDEQVLEDHNKFIEEEAKPKVFEEKVPISSLPPGFLDRYHNKEVTELNGYKIIGYTAGWCFDYPKGFYLTIEVDQNKLK